MTSRARISRKLVRPVGFSNGCAELALTTPPPFVPSSLIDSWLAIGPAVDRLGRALHRGRVHGAPQRLHDTEAGEHDGQDQRQREQNAGHAPCEVDPEVADRLRPMAREAADQGDGDRHADRGRGEVLHGEPGHLRQVAHRRFAAVVLPVRVGDEAHGGVEGEERRDRLHRRWVERQPALEALQGVQTKHRHQAQGDDRARVHDPGLLLVGSYAADTVDQPLERQEHAVAGRGATAVDFGEVRAEQPRPEQQQPDQGGDLEPCGGGHRASPAGAVTAGPRAR